MNKIKDYFERGFMKKKSRIGYVKKRWWIVLPKTNILDFNYVQHSEIYRTPFTDSLKNKFYTKVKITIEEIK